MAIDKIRKFNVNSPEVKNAKVSEKEFITTIRDCYEVNGSKYRPGIWRDNMFEIETSNGVFISTKNFIKWKGKKIKVCSNTDNRGKYQDDISWVWLNYIQEDNQNVSDDNQNVDNTFFEIQEALSMNVPKTICFVYKLEIGNEIYIGFTTQKPKKRMEAHIAKSKEGGMQKINKALRKWGYIYNLEILGEYQNEIEGLISEIKNIEKFNCSLNKSIGGEGNQFSIVINKNEFNEDVFIVHDKNNILIQK